MDPKCERTALTTQVYSKIDAQKDIYTDAANHHREVTSNLIHYCQDICYCVQIWKLAEQSISEKRKKQKNRIYSKVETSTPFIGGTNKVVGICIGKYPNFNISGIKDCIAKFYNAAGWA